jgi:hypothetical protein
VVCDYRLWPYFRQLRLSAGIYVSKQRPIKEYGESARDASWLFDCVVLTSFTVELHGVDTTDRYSDVTTLNEKNITKKKPGKPGFSLDVKPSYSQYTTT